MHGLYLEQQERYLNMFTRSMIGIIASQTVGAAVNRIFSDDGGTTIRGIYAPGEGPTNDYAYISSDGVVLSDTMDTLDGARWTQFLATNGTFTYTGGAAENRVSSNAGLFNNRQETTPVFTWGSDFTYTLSFENLSDFTPDGNDQCLVYLQVNIGARNLTIAMSNGVTEAGGTVGTAYYDSDGGGWTDQGTGFTTSGTLQIKRTQKTVTLLVNDVTIHTIALAQGEIRLVNNIVMGMQGRADSETCAVDMTDFSATTYNNGIIRLGATWKKCELIGTTATNPTTIDWMDQPETGNAGVNYPPESPSDLVGLPLSDFDPTKEGCTQAYNDRWFSLRGYVPIAGGGTPDISAADCKLLTDLNGAGYQYLEVTGLNIASGSYENTITPISDSEAANHNKGFDAKVAGTGYGIYHQKEPGYSSRVLKAGSTQYTGSATKLGAIEGKWVWNGSTIEAFIGGVSRWSEAMASPVDALNIGGVNHFGGATSTNIKYGPTIIKDGGGDQVLTAIAGEVVT